MPELTLLLLLVAIVVAVLVFGSIAGAAAGIAKTMFVIFWVLLVPPLLFGRRARQ